MPHYTVHGADRETAEDVSITVVADTEAEAAEHARGRMLVSDVYLTPVPAGIPAQPRHRPSLAAATAIFLSLTLALLSIGWSFSLASRLNRAEAEIVRLRQGTADALDSTAKLWVEMSEVETRLQYVRRVAENADRHSHSHGYR
jgi:hypothetical protein